MSVRIVVLGGGVGGTLELRREDMIDGLGAPAGATAMLLEAQDAITLFI